MIVCGHCMSAHKRPLKFFTCKLKLFRTYNVAAFFFFFFFFGYVWERNSCTLIYPPMFISWVTARGRRNKVSFILQQQQFITQIAPKFQVIKSNSQKIHPLDEGCSCWQGQGSSCRQTWASHSLESQSQVIYIQAILWAYFRLHPSLDHSKQNHTFSSKKQENKFHLRHTSFTTFTLHGGLEQASHNYNWKVSIK